MENSIEPGVIGMCRVQGLGFTCWLLVGNEGTDNLELHTLTLNPSEMIRGLL